jgi:hypothetical protein
MKTQAKYSYRNPKVWCVQPPTERRPTLCNDLYNHDQYNPYNNPYEDNDPYNDPHNHVPYHDPYNNLYSDPYNDSTDDSSDNPSDDLCHDSYRMLYTNAYNDLHDNKDINPSILALEAKFDLAIENFFASLTMTPATRIPNFVTVYEDDNPENSNPDTPADTANCDTNNNDNPDNNANPDIFLSVSSVPNAANSLHATMADRAHCLLLTALLSSSHPRMNNLVSLLPSNHESPLPPPEPLPPGASNIVFAQPANCHDTTVQVQPRLFTPLHTLQLFHSTPHNQFISRLLRVQLPDVRSVGG